MSLINEFICTVENEIKNDDRIYQLYHVDSRNYSFLPRPAKWLARTQKHQNFLFSLGFSLRFFWLIGGAFVFFSYQLVRSAISFLSTADRLSEIHQKTEFGLAFSSRAKDIINMNSIGRMPQAWISLPWLGLRQFESQPDVFSLYSMLNFKDLIHAWWLSIQSIYCLWKKKTASSSVLQGYTAFHWFLTRIALSKIKQGHFYTAEHLDRWALLIDFVVVRLNAIPENTSSLSIVQHGLLESLTGSGQRSQADPLIIPHRLKSVSSIYVYDNDSANVFIQSILSPLCAPAVIFFKPKIQLQMIEKNDQQISILFVGHSICEDMQVHLFQQLQKSISIKGYYKPHPTCAPHHSVRSQDWILIEDPLFYPAVDLLISYPSTLVTEYANYEIPAIIHPINLSLEDTAPILGQIQNQLAKISL